MDNSLLDEIKRLKTIADLGLLYADNEYDKERYSELREMSFRLLNAVSGHSLDRLKQNFPLVKDYPTPKVDIRGLLLSPDNKVLLVKESLDNKWSLPGGWADVGYSPREVMIKEFKEETGLDITAEKLLAVFDKRKHPHPPQPFYVYTIIFYCKAITFQLHKGFDVLDVQYFTIDNLPELSEERMLKQQIELLYNKVMSANFEAYVD